VIKINKDMNKHNNNTILRTGLLLILFTGLFALSCKDDINDQLNLSRQFKPAAISTQNGPTSALISWNASLFTLPGEVQYKIELAKDSLFSTVEFTATTTATERTVLDTEIETLVDYFARVKAIGANGSGDSNWQLSGRFQITGEIWLLTVREYDVSADQALIRWSDGPILKITFKPAGGTAFDVAVSDPESTAGQKLVGSLASGTTFTATIYTTGNVPKGSQTFTTKLSYGGSNIVDLTAIDLLTHPNIIADTLPDIPSGSVILLKRGMQYDIPAASATLLDKSFTLTSAPDFIQQYATVRMLNNFNLPTGVNPTIDSLVFKDLNIYSENAAAYSGKYIFNINQIGEIGTVRFENVRAHRFRGLFRMQTGTTGTHVVNFFMNNSVVDSLRDFSLVNANNSNSVANIRVTNSTIFYARKVIDHRSAGSLSMVFTNCTFNNLVAGGPAGGGSFYFIDLNTFDVANGITITNCIYGKSWDEGMGGTDVRGYRAGALTNITVNNSYQLSDYISTANTLPLLAYNKASTAVFADPNNGNFTIIDASFPGATNCGDPRWR